MEGQTLINNQASVLNISFNQQWNHKAIQCIKDKFIENVFPTSVIWKVKTFLKYLQI